MVFQMSSNYNGYSGLNMQNINSGNNASFDIFITPDNGTASDTFLDLGMGSSTYNYSGYTMIGPNDGYLIAYGNTNTGGGNMIIATGAPNDIIFTANGVNTGNEIARFKNNVGLVMKNLPIKFADSTSQNTAAAPFSFSNSIFVQANASFVQANSAYNTANSAGVYANGAFATANTKLAASGFTNNGVMYANGTGYVVNGSALTWNGSTFFVNGTIQQGNGGAATIGKIWNDSGVYSVQADYTNVNGLKLDSPAYTVFTLNNAEQMRLTSTGLGIGTSSPTTKLTVVGTTTSNSVAITNSSATVNTTIVQSTTATTSQTAIDTWSTSTYRTAKYLVQMTQGSNYHTIELLLIQNGTTAYLTQYGEVTTGTILGTFDASISGSTLSLLINPVSATSMTINLVRDTISV